MTRKTDSSLRNVLLFAALLLVLPSAARAQQAEQPEGVNSGNYNIRQSFEFGGRITDFTGNQAVYRTFDNLTDGPRLFEHTLQMRSLNHAGWLFDDFFLSSFGYGGDPNAVTRLRAYKNKWYNFSASFRLDRNQWDFNLLANPLNPTNSNPFVPTSFSLHKMETVRRLADYSLTLLPQSRVRLRLGYARNIMEGPSFTTFHEGTDVLTFQNWKTTLNSYSFGLDFRGLPKTNISYDQFFHYYKGDNTWADTVGATQLSVPRFFAQLSTGVPVDLGIIFNTAASQPCAVPITSTANTPPTANATCNAYVFYERFGNVRTNYPTEQLSFQTSYFRALDMSARLVYSSSDNDVVGYREGYLGRVSRTNQRVFAINGPAEAKRVSVTADYAVTWQPWDKVRFVDTFHFTYFRIPGSFELAECSLFGTSMVVNPTRFTGQGTVPANCATVLAATATAATSGTPAHSTSSSADVMNEDFSLFLGQNLKQNQFEALYDFTPRLAARLGYRYTNRKITEAVAETDDLLFFPNNAARGACAFLPAPAPPGTLPSFCTMNPDGSIRGLPPQAEETRRTNINEHVFLLGLSARPADPLRMSFDLELASADRAFTRISPRQFQLYRFRGTYRPAHWFSFGFVFNILEKRNKVVEIFHQQHNRTYGFSTVLEPNERFNLDFGYDFNDVFSQTNICFTGTVRPPGTSPCPTAAALLQQVSLYDQDTHFGYFSLGWRPVRRVKTLLGYSLVSTSGTTLILTPNTPTGPLAYNYHRPYAGVDFELARGFIFRSHWGYYGYNEKSLPDPTTAPRDFRGNVVTLSMRYAF